MNEDKARAIIDLAMGLKHYEWNRINQAVEQAFKKAEARIEFTPELAQSAGTLLGLEEGGGGETATAIKHELEGMAIIRSRRAFVNAITQNFKPGDIYIALTWSPGEFKADKAPQQTRDFIRRIRRLTQRNHQPVDAFRWLYICDLEPQRHILLHGPMPWMAKQIEAQWKHGRCLVSRIEAPVENLACYLLEKLGVDPKNNYFASGNIFIPTVSE